MSFVVDNIVIDTFSHEILSKKLSGYMLDEIIDGTDIDELSKIENNVRNSKTTKKITSKFVNTIIENIIYNGNLDMNIENEVDMLISKYLPNKFSGKKQQDIKTNVIEQITNTQKGLQDTLLFSFGNDYFIILKAYHDMTARNLRIMTITLALAAIIILCVLEKYDALKSMKHINISITIIMSAAFVLIHLLSNFIDQKLAGGWLQQIHTASLVVSILIGIIMSILFHIACHKTITAKSFY